jgi:NAD(P)-dependent dehydrogenase (short-subunit alcohol dehydrogenase family)
MTKAGLLSLTRSFAREYGSQGVRVNAILPGVVETRFAQALVDDPEVQKMLARIPAARAGQPEDMVGGVLYLVSDAAAYTTGTTLVMDGGLTLGERFARFVASPILVYRPNRDGVVAPTNF